MNIVSSYGILVLQRIRICDIYYTMASISVPVINE